jgi:hypothetical protein
MSAVTAHATVRLNGDMVLRIRDGRGTRLRCAGGTVWVTQEGSANDTVLDMGTGMVVEFDGTTLAGAHRGTPVFVEVHAGTIPPRLIDTADAAGRQRRLFPPGSRLVALLRRGTARAIELLKVANDRDADFDAARALEWSDGVPARGVRHAAMQRAETLHRESLDQSTLWRQP